MKSMLRIKIISRRCSLLSRSNFLSEKGSKLYGNIYEKLRNEQEERHKPLNFDEEKDESSKL